MKKMFLMVAMLLATSFNAMADDTKGNFENVSNKYDFSVNANSLVKYLNLSKEQTDYVLDIHNAFSEAMIYAGTLDEEKRKNMIRSAVEYDIKNMREFLDKKQYKKYLTILNVTFSNRNIDFK